MSEPDTSKSQLPEVRGYLPDGPEWGTFSLILLCYLLWLGILFWLVDVSLTLAVLAAAATITLHSSLSHEVLHGHPFRSRILNEALMFLPLGLAIPYGRFRDTHLDHHRDENLTDPYDDPESNFQDPSVWSGLCSWQRGMLRFNNTLLGRMLVGPLLGQMCFMKGDLKTLSLKNSPQRWPVLRDWALHLIGLVPVLWIVTWSDMPIWSYLLASYLALSLLKVRTYLEHRAHEDMHSRTAIVEDRGPLAFLFLNNNLHVVHHLYPGVPWHRLPGLYAAGRAEFQKRNDGYVLRSYGTVFARYFLRSKDPVPHPLWQQGE